MTDLVDISTWDLCSFNNLDNSLTKTETEPETEKEIVKNDSPLEILSHISDSNLSVWEKIQRMQSLSNRLLSDSSLSSNEMSEMKDLMNLIAEDLVQLLLREQQIIKDKQNLQEKLDKSMSQADIAALGLANKAVSCRSFSVSGSKKDYWEETSEWTPLERPARHGILLANITHGLKLILAQKGDKDCHVLINAPWEMGKPGEASTADIAVVYRLESLFVLDQKPQLTIEILPKDLKKVNDESFDDEICLAGRGDYHIQVNAVTGVYGAFKRENRNEIAECKMEENDKIVLHKKCEFFLKDLVPFFKPLAI